MVPRTYIASKVVVDREPLKSLDQLSSTEFDPVKEVILKANFFFRGVALSPGNHIVVFRYGQASFYYGIILDLAFFTAGIFYQL